MELVVELAVHRTASIATNLFRWATAAGQVGSGFVATTISTRAPRLTTEPPMAIGFPLQLPHTLAELTGS